MNLLKSLYMENQSPEEQNRIMDVVRLSLQDYLDKNYKLIKALRARAQFLDVGNLDMIREVTKEIDKMVLPELTLTHFLCEISDTHTIEEHNPVNFDPTKSVRGFYLQDMVSLGDRLLSFGLLDLDGGLSRKFFDDKDEDEKKAFMKRILNRSSVVGGPNGPEGYLPPHAITFISDQGGSYKIERMEIAEFYLTGSVPYWYHQH